MKTLEIIGRYKPRVYSRKNVERAIRRALRKTELLMRDDGVEVRSYNQMRYYYAKYKGTRNSPFRWHHDRLGSDPGRIVLWTNKQSTEVRTKRTHKRVIIPESAIVVFCNNVYEHKAPKKAPKRGRWFARVIVKSPRS